MFKKLLSLAVLATAVHCLFTATADKAFAEANAPPQSGCQWAPDGSYWCPPPAAPQPAPTPAASAATGLDSSTLVLALAILIAAIMVVWGFRRRNHGEVRPVAPQPPPGGGGPVVVIALLVGLMLALALSAAPNAAMAQAPAPGLVQVAPPNPRIAELEAKVAEAKVDVETALRAAEKYRGSSTKERRRFNQAVNDANAKVAQLEAALKAAQGETDTAKAASAAAKAETDKAKSAFAHCEGLEAAAKEDCLEAEAARQASLSQLQTSREPDAGLILGGITHDGKAAVVGLALGRGWVKYKIRNRDGKGDRVDFEARIDPQFSAPATTTTTELAAAPAPSTGSSWKRYLGACAVGGVGFAGFRGFDYYNSRTPRQVDGDHALALMGTAAATGCAGGVVAMAAWDGAVYAFSE